jgi:hypothetical protein
MTIRTQQLRRLRNCTGGVDEIRALFVDEPADIATWYDNAIALANERNPFEPLAPRLGLAEIHRRLAHHFPGIS